MNYTSIYLSRKELRRFLEIADGDTKASNTPEEDALFRQRLVKETMMVFANLDTISSSVDMRAVVLSDLGREYYAQYMNQQKRDQTESFRHFQNIAIAVIGILITVLGIIITLLLTVE